MQMEFFWVQVHFHFLCESKPIACVSLGLCQHTLAFWFHSPCSCTSGALTTTALSWAPRPALPGCSLQPDAQLPSCPSYRGGLFPCTPSPGPRTRWAAEPHKYFLHAARLNRNLHKLIQVSLCGGCLCSPQQWTWRAELPPTPHTHTHTHSFKVWNEHIIVPRRLAVPAVNVHNSRWCCAVVFRFLKLLRSPGKDCPRFRALMTETFESQPYQRFLRAHQVRQNHRRRPSHTVTRP